MKDFFVLFRRVRPSFSVVIRERFLVVLPESISQAPRGGDGEDSVTTHCTRRARRQDNGGAVMRIERVVSSCDDDCATGAIDGAAVVEE